MHDAFLLGKSALNQLASGLEAVRVLQLIKLFPEEFEWLLTYQSSTRLTPAYMLELLQLPTQMNEDQKRDS